jgi:ABC-type transport system substrate-binding protein
MCHLFGKFRIVFFIAFFCIGCTKSKKQNLITLAFPASWSKLSPHLQNNYYGSVIINSAFNSLLGTDKSGATIPLAANDWVVSSDYKTFIFKIDTSLQYSDGTYLKAVDFKKAWEFALKTDPNAFNVNVGDALYFVEGIEKFKLTGQLEGIIAESNDTLKIKFNKPFRKGIDEFKGARLAVSKMKDGKIIGTGAYVIENENDATLSLVPNKYHDGHEKRPKLKILVVNYEDAISNLKNNKIDFYYSGGLNKRIGYKPDLENINIIYGQESIHSTFILNAMNGRFFKNSRYRLAMQYLVLEIIDSHTKEITTEIGVRPNKQVYLSYQAGALKDSEIQSLVDEGKKYVEELIKKTRKHPLVFYFHPEWNWIKSELEKKGIVFSHKSLDFVKEKIDNLNVYYKTYEPDIMTFKSSLANGDPDGLYHLLGKEGAISSPMLFRESVSELLDKGRSALAPEKIKEIYKKVSYEVLKEVPFIHIGFMSSLVLYNKKRVKPVYEIIDRNENFIDGFREM